MPIPMATPGHRGRLARVHAALGDMGIRLLGSHVTGIGVERCASAGAALRAPLPEGALLA